MNIVQKMERLVKIQNLRSFGYSQTEIATMLNTSQQVVSYNLKIIKKMHEEIGEGGEEE